MRTNGIIKSACWDRVYEFCGILAVTQSIDLGVPRCCLTEQVIRRSDSQIFMNFTGCSRGQGQT